MAKKKYKIIAKVCAKGLKGNDGFCKWNCNDLLSFVKFLDSEYPEWCWFNVFDKDTKAQIANFTKFNRPLHRHL